MSANSALKRNGACQHLRGSVRPVGSRHGFFHSRNLPLKEGLGAAPHPSGSVSPGHPHLGQYGPVLWCLCLHVPQQAESQVPLHIVQKRRSQGSERVHDLPEATQWLSRESNIPTTSLPNPRVAKNLCQCGEVHLGGFGQQTPPTQPSLHMQACSQCMCVLSRFSCVRLFATPWTVACQAPLSMGFSRQEYCSGLPFPSLGDLLDPGIELTFLVSPALTGNFFTTSTTWEALMNPQLLLLLLSCFSRV